MGRGRPADRDEQYWRQQRYDMVQTQIERRRVSDPRVLAAMREVPRHPFVPDHMRGEAYSDQALPIGHGQTISQPYIVATMLEALALRGPEKALDIGAGSGYQTAVLSRLCEEVIGIERIPELARAAAARLAKLGYLNATIIEGDGTAGVKAEAPFDAIIAGAGSPEVPRPLVAQLAVGGRLVIPVGDRHLQKIVIVRKTEDGVKMEDGIGCVFVPLVGEYGWG
jgi:protein-L-isoaspartate(D-aspartate) O-methyltransferase